MSSLWKDLPTDQFDLAYIDFPVLWRTRSPKGDGKQPPYPRYPLSVLKTFPLRSLLKKDSSVVMWVCDPHLFEMKELCDHFGLRFSTRLINWVKLTKTGKQWHFGLGKTTRANPEDAWLLHYGKGLKRRSTKVPRLLVAPVEDHSRKPAEARLRLEKLFGQVDRIELFAREISPGWTPWGDQLPEQ